MSEQEPMVVMFRRFRDGAREIIAIFPEIPADTDGLMVTSFMHPGGHGQASPDVVYWTVRAKPEEYQSLMLELESEPYNYVLDIRERTPKDAADKRRKAVRNG